MRYHIDINVLYHLYVVLIHIIPVLINFSGTIHALDFFGILVIYMCSYQAMLSLLLAVYINNMSFLDVFD